MCVVLDYKRTYLTSFSIFQQMHFSLLDKTDSINKTKFHQMTVTKLNSGLIV